MKKIITFTLAFIFTAGIMNPVSVAAASKNGIEILNSDYEYYQYDYIWEDYYNENYEQYYYEGNSPIVGYGYFLNDTDRYGSYNVPVYGYEYYLQDMYEYAPEYIYAW